MSPLFRLPGPVLLDILDLVLKTKNSEIKVLSVCKYLRGFAEDIIYRSIELNYWETVISDSCYRLHRLIQNLLKRDDLAQRVRFLSISSSLDYSRVAYSRVDSQLSNLTFMINRLTSDAKEPERIFLRGLGLQDEDVWLEALDGDVAGLYASIIVMLTPNLTRLTLHVQDGFEFAG